MRGRAVSKLTASSALRNRAFTKSASRSSSACILSISDDDRLHILPSRNRIFSALAIITPSCIDAPFPSIELRITLAPDAFASDAVSSVEPSSTTIVSLTSGWARINSTREEMLLALFSTGMMTENKVTSKAFHAVVIYQGANNPAFFINVVSQLYNRIYICPNVNTIGL